MAERPESDIVGTFQKCGRLLTRGVITSSEFCDKAFELFDDYDRVDPHVIPVLWEAVPDVIRTEFVGAIEQAMSPGYRRKLSRAGFVGCPTEEQLRRDADLRTGRVRAWAQEFSDFLGGSRPIPKA